MKYTFVARANGNKQHVLVSIYRIWSNPFEHQMQFFVGIDGQARLKSIGIVHYDPSKMEPITVPTDILTQACILQGVEFMGWLA